MYLNPLDERCRVFIGQLCDFRVLFYKTDKMFWCVNGFMSSAMAI